MTTFQTIILVCLALLNAATFVTFGIDKWRERHNNKQAKKKKVPVYKDRISEWLMLGLAALGGTIGAMIGMLIFKNKMDKKKFIWGVPVLMILHIVIFVKYIL